MNKVKKGATMQLVKTILHPTGLFVLRKDWTRTYNKNFWVARIYDVKIYFKDELKVETFENEVTHFVIKQGRKKLFEFVGTEQEVKDFVKNFLYGDWELS